jgi:hypothetical protein
MYPGMSPKPMQQQKMPGHLSNVQMKLLSAQIKAYRCLARNMALPDQLKTFIMSHAANVSGRTTPTTLSTNQPSPQPPLADNNSSLQSPPQTQPPLSSGPPTMASTGSPAPPTTSTANQNEEKSADGGKTAGSTAKGQTQLRPVKLTSINKPSGIDPDTVIKEREIRLRIQLSSCFNNRFLSLSLFLFSSFHQQDKV